MIKEGWKTVLSHHPRRDLIEYVLNQCAIVPPEKMNDLKKMISWCEERFGERRPGSILMEAIEGRLDYFDGDWCNIYDEIDCNRYLFWFANQNDKMLFALTWL